MMRRSHPELRDYWAIVCPRTTEAPGVHPAVQRVHLRRVEQCAYYFKREHHYDFPQFGTEEHVRWDGTPAPDDGRPYLFVHEDRHVGAAIFRWRQYTNVPAGWWLAWVWLHPYVRRCGLLTRAWPTFTATYPGFFVEPPLSNGMRHFLDKHAYPWHPGLVDPAISEATR
jgi:hypothetical protein